MVCFFLSVSFLSVSFLCVSFLSVSFISSFTATCNLGADLFLSLFLATAARCFCFSRRLCSSKAALALVSSSPQHLHSSGWPVKIRGSGQKEQDIIAKNAGS